MTLIRRLADEVLERYPDRAATVLERVGEAEGIRTLERGGADGAAMILQRLSPQYATGVLHGLRAERAAEILGGLPVDVATRMVRRLRDDTRQAILERLDPRFARSIQSVLRFPEGVAGALMDPDVLALPEQLSAREALSRVRAAAEFARYNVYVVDQAQSLVGALNLRELLLARGRTPLSELMVREPHRVQATADRASVMSHPGWRAVHSLPVVDEQGAYLGAIRYRTLRELEDELQASQRRDADAGAAIGQVIAAGARGLLDALAGPAPSGEGRQGGG
jgi:magnesium transporter